MSGTMSETEKDLERSGQRPGGADDSLRTLRPTQSVATGEGHEKR